MRVLTHEAVNDPTKIEAQVRREMVAREKGHIKMNQERKLTDEERKAKAQAKADADAAKGIGALVFKFVSLLSRALARPLTRFTSLQGPLPLQPLAQVQGQEERHRRPPHRSHLSQPQILPRRRRRRSQGTQTLPQPHA